MDGPAIDLRDVAKTYRGKVEALRGVAMQVMPGEIFGLLGPNGAGKSTLVKILTTVIRPTRAAGTLLGRPIGHKPTLARVGYLPEHLRFPPYLTGRQAVEFFAALSKVDRRTRRRRAGELLDQVRMTSAADRKLGTYSKGMQQRIGLAQALVAEPDLVVLDEPTDGLDPMGRREVREMLLRLRAQGKTVFVNSHLLGEVERVCDRVAILAAGRIVRQGTLDELAAGSESYEIELAEARPEDVRSAIGLQDRSDQPAASALPQGEEAPGAQAGPIEIVGAKVRIRTGDPAAVQPVIDALRRRGLVIQAVRPVRQSLEDLFVAAVSGESPADAEGGRP
jgi:ABC-2 type transport system ATP-binding protein